MPKKIFKSISHATRGIWISIQEERNMKIHVVAACSVIVFSWYLGVSLSDWLILLVLLALVLAAEMMNAAIERICDILRDRYNLPYEGSRDIRDIAAGFVWIKAIAAFIIGLLIFGKYLL